MTLLLWPIAAGLLLILGLATYTLLLRFESTRRDGRRAHREIGWSEVVARVLASGPSAPDASALLDGLPDPEAASPEVCAHLLDFLVRHAMVLKGAERATIEAMAAPFLPRLVPLLGVGDSFRRAHAVRCLGQLGLPTHDSRMLEALQDEDPAVAMVAAQSLARGGDVRHLEAILSTFPRFERWSQPYLVGLLANFGSGAAPLLLEVLQDRRSLPSLRAVAADVLAERNRLEAADPAARLLKEGEEDGELVSALLRLLAKLGSPRHLEPIRPLARSPLPYVRLLALRAVSALGRGREEAPLLREALHDPFSWAALEGARGLREIGDRDSLLELIDSGSTLARMAEEVIMEES